jgi:hypothetical protein
MRHRYHLLVAALTNACDALSLARYYILAVLLAVFTVGTTPDVELSDPASVDPWAQHPALQQFDIAGKELPATLYLIRTRGELPETDGVVVYGVHNGLYLVSGDAKAVKELAHNGYAVIPLRNEPAAPTPPNRPWTWIHTPDPAIAGMVAKVKWEDISNQIQWLVDYGTRYSFAPNHYEVASAIRDTLASYGLQASLLPFEMEGYPEWEGYTLWNVEAIQPGIVYPNSFVVICGHFDSITRGDPMHSAPGADDNATGTVAVLTAARILSRYSFERSIIYLCCAGEEQGLYGSLIYAQAARLNDVDIFAALNFDMLGYWKPGVRRDLEVEVNYASRWVGSAVLNSARLYTTAPHRLHVYDGAWWGDHASFWYFGYPAANHEESWDWYDPDFNPGYHTNRDLPEYLWPDFATDNIQVGVASLATLAQPIPVDVVFDVIPGSCRNPFNPKSRGVKNALVLGSADVDVRDIDIEVLRLEGTVSPMSTRVADMAAPGDDHGHPCADMSRDGYDDLRLTFSARDIAEAIGPVAKGDTLRLLLTGCLADGTGIRGEDTVVIVGEQGEELETALSFESLLTNTGTSAVEPPPPETFALYQNFPNPFNPSTSIPFDVPFAGAVVTLRIYDVNGRLVRTLVNGEQSAGQKLVAWDGRNETGDPVATGIYLYHLTGPGFAQTRKMIMLK